VTYFPFLREERGTEHVRYGSFVSNEPVSIPVEKFLASLRFENRGKLDDLGLDILFVSQFNV
jgi:hypothetical protein